MPGGLFREDWLAFETRALDYRIDDAVVGALSGERVTELYPGSLLVGAATWILIAGALVTRWGLGRVKDRLPAWMVAVRIYVDALWVFLVLSFSVNQGLTLLINPTKWIAQRRIMVWFSETRGQLFSHLQPLEVVWDTAMWILRTAFGGVAVPLMWLAVAGIVYGVGITADWRGAVQRIAGQQAGEADHRQHRHPDRGAQPMGQTAEVPAGQGHRTCHRSARQVQADHRCGPGDHACGNPALALYVLAYVVLAWLDMTGAFYGVVSGDGYLLRGMAWALGPHRFGSGGPSTELSR